MRVISLNANGIRAAARKGVFDWLQKQKADFVCVQETKAQVHQLEDEVFHPAGYHCSYHDAEKKGYSGVAVYSKHEPDNTTAGIGQDWFDNEGRWLKVDVGQLSVISLYLPSGTSGDERQQYKYRSMEMLEPVLQGYAADGRDYIVCGDWNIAHTKKDIKNWRGNQKHSGFLPEERAWLDTVFGPVGMVDAFRVVDDRDEQYTWWSNRGQAWANNTGWRIDYHVISPGLKKKVKTASVYKDERFSDHAPLIIDYSYRLKRS